MGQIIYREYIVFQGSNISCVLATVVRKVHMMFFTCVGHMVCSVFCVCFFFFVCVCVCVCVVSCLQ